ncbi:unnamed protein product [Chrysoparadoxa australica]
MTVPVCCFIVLALVVLRSVFMRARRSAARKYPVSGNLISVIIPAYNEATVVENTLKLLTQRAKVKKDLEIILVDGGCTDDTMAKALRVNTGITTRTAESKGGRGPALNAGAAEAQGDLLLFLHADAAVPDAFDNMLRSAFTDAQGSLIMTAFRFRINRAELVGRVPLGMSVVEAVTNLRAKHLSLPYGDQALCTPAAAFKQLGGYPPYFMMEDYEFVQRVRSLLAKGEGSYQLLSKPVLCSPRRWEQQGVIKTTLLNVAFVFMYSALGFSPKRIFQLYYGKSA